MPTPEEIDLTDTPPKKMKQARLPFATLDKVSISPKIGKFPSRNIISFI